MNKIEITYKPDPLPPHLSGPALRAAQAADRQAEAVVSRIRAAASRLEVVLCSKDVSAALLAEAYAALAEYEAALASRSELPKRHRIEVQDGPKCWDGGAYGRPGIVIQDIGSTYLRTLVNAGIPMPGGPIHSAQYWQDAAARGC